MKKLGELTVKALSSTEGQNKPSLALSQANRNLILSKYPEFTKFALTYNPDACLVRYDIYQTEKAALLSETLRLNQLTSVYSKDAAVGWIGTWIVKICEQLKLELEDYQVKIDALLLYSEIYMFNLAEVSLFFKKFMLGHYGHFYGKFNIQILSTAARQYRSTRGKILSNMTTKQQNNIINFLKNEQA